jgi:guanylate kinase
LNKLLFIVTGPSGAGKNTVMTHIYNTFPEIKKAVTYTTRAPRPHEQDGVDYRFIGQEEFFAKVREGKILEYEQVYNDYYYGSPAEIFADGPIKIMEMDWKGHRTYRQVYKDIRIASIFLVPPSLEEIKKRILGRSQVDNLQSRLANALEQLEHAHDYTYIIVNDQKDRTLQQVEALVRAELINLKRKDNLEHARGIVNSFNKDF